MKKVLVRLPNGVACLLVIVVIFGYMAWVMGMSNMLNTIMNTAHQLLLNTVFYLMGMCVITGALGKILVEFGVVDLLQKLLRPVMKPLFNMPGVASLGAVLTFLSDNPAIIALSQDRGFACYFKKYQHVSLVNFGTAFGMGLLVIIFMVGQGYYGAPFIGLFAAICGCVISTRTMQYFTCKDFPEYRTEDAVSAEDMADYNASQDAADSQERKQTTLFVRVLNALLDGGKEGVHIGLAIIPGVLIISTFVMMLTFGPSTEVVDGKTVKAFTGAAFQGTHLLPWLASQINVVFEWLFGFTAPELVAFPITALGAVGAALSLIPEFANQGILNGNAIAVCTAMGMCWSGYLSTDAATLDSLGYRALVPRAFFSTFIGGICAGIIAHWTFVLVTFIGTIFAPAPVWETKAEAWNDTTNESLQVKIQAYDDGSYTIKDWYGIDGEDLCFTVNAKDSTVNITNAYSDVNNEYYFVHINEDAKTGESAYAVLYPVHQYSEFAGDKKSGWFYVFAFVYDKEMKELNRCYYEVTWGDGKRQTVTAEESLEKAIKSGAIHQSDSLARALRGQQKKVNQ